MDSGATSISSNVRRLGSRENYFAEFQEEHFQGILVYFVLVKSKSVIRLEQTIEALRRLQLRHQALRLTFICEHESGCSVRYFKELPGTKVSLGLVANTDKRRAMEMQQRTRFKEGDLLWRVNQLDPERTTAGWDYPFLFTFHHVAFDGTSVVSGVLGSFLDFLDNVIRNRPYGLIQSLPVPPPIERIHFKCSGGSMRHSSLPKGATTSPREGAEKSRPFVNEDNLSQPGGDVAVNEDMLSIYTSIADGERRVMTAFYDAHRTNHPEPVTGIVDLDFGAEDTERIVRACRTRCIMVTGFCAAVAAEAMVRLLSNIGIEVGTFDSKVRCTVNLRPFADERISEDRVGLVFDACAPKIKIDDAILDADRNSECFWNLAKSYHDELHHMLKNGKHFEDVQRGMCDPLEELSKLAKHRDKFSPSPQYTETFFAISNLGRHSLETSGADSPEITLDEVYFLSSNIFKSSTLCSQKMLTVNGRLFWSLTYNKMLMNEDLANQYGALIRDVIQSHAYVQ